MPVVGLLLLSIHLEQANSLKDKRNVLRSLKARLRSRFNVSVAEVGDQSLWNRSEVAVVAVSASRSYVEGLLKQVEEAALAQLGDQLEAVTVSWLEDWAED